MQEDKELMDKVDYALGESTEIYRILQDRLDLYKEAEKYPVIGYYKLLLNGMKQDVMHEIMLFKTRQDFDEQVSQIVTRLDTIENEIKLIKSKINDS